MTLDHPAAYQGLVAVLSDRGMLHEDGRLVAGWGCGLGESRLRALGVGMYHDRPAEVFRRCEEWQLRELAAAIIGAANAAE